MRKHAPTLPALLGLLATTDLDCYAVVRHGYREVCVTDVTDGPFEYTSGDTFDLLQRRLAAAADSRVDNHECYVVTYPDGQQLCLWFHDWRVAVGTAVHPY